MGDGTHGLARCSVSSLGPSLTLHVVKRMPRRQVLDATHGRTMLTIEGLASAHTNLRRPLNQDETQGYAMPGLFGIRQGRPRRSKWSLLVQRGFPLNKREALVKGIKKAASLYRVFTTATYQRQTLQELEVASGIQDIDRDRPPRDFILCNQRHA